MPLGLTDLLRHGEISSENACETIEKTGRLYYVVVASTRRQMGINETSNGSSRGGSLLPPTALNIREEQEDQEAVPSNHHTETATENKVGGVPQHLELHLSRHEDPALRVTRRWIPVALSVFKSIQATTLIQTHPNPFHGEYRHSVRLYRSSLYRCKSP